MRTSALPAPIAAPIELLDRARLLWLRALGPLAAPLVRSRELRVAVFATLSIVAALALTALAPIWLLALGPIALGVPHVASDIRYLVMRPGLWRRPLFWVLVAAPLAVLVGTLDVRWGLAAMLGASIGARGTWVRRAAVVAGSALVLGLAWRHVFLTALLIAHLHNFAAIGIWLAWRRRRSWLHAIPLLAFVLGCIAVLAGALDPILLASGGLDADTGEGGLWYHLATLAPAVPQPWGVRLVLLFAFSQSVHYAIWVRLVPEEDRPRETPRTWAATLRAWRRDSGWWVIAAFVVLSIALAIGALVDLVAAREGYLRSVIFHGYLEFAVIAWLLVEGRGLRTEVEAPVRA